MTSPMKPDAPMSVEDLLSMAKNAYSGDLPSIDHAVFDRVCAMLRLAIEQRDKWAPLKDRLAGKIAQQTIDAQNEALARLARGETV